MIVADLMYKIEELEMKMKKQEELMEIVTDCLELDIELERRLREKKKGKKK